MKPVGLVLLELNKELYFSTYLRVGNFNITTSPFNLMPLGQNF